VRSFAIKKVLTASLEKH